MRLEAAILVLAAGCLGADAVVTSIAGVGPTQRDLVEGRPATDAVLGEVHALALDGNGGLLVGAQRLLVRVDPDGVAHSVAGVGTIWFADGLAGDNIAAESAPIAYLRGVARAPDGSIYFSDAALQTVRRIGRDGLVTTVLPFSAGYLSPRALSFDDAGNLYVAVLGRRESGVLRGAIVKVTPEGHIAALDLRNPDGSPAFLNQPEGLTIDLSGALYVTEFGGHRVRKVVDGVVTTLAGTGSGGFSGDGGRAAEAELRGPSGVAAAGDGTVYIADTLNNRIRVVAPGGAIDTLRWTTPAVDVSSLLSAPAHIIVDPATHALYVAEYLGYRVRKIEAGTVTTVAGNGKRMVWLGDAGDGGPALLARLFNPEGIAMCDGRLYVADTSNALIRMITPDGWIDSVAGNGEVQGAAGDGGPAREASIGLPAAVACDGRGNVYIADRGRPRIRKVDASGIITTILGDGSFTDPDLREPLGIAADAAGNIFVTDRLYARVLKVMPDGNRTVLWSGRPGDFPHAIALDSEGRPYFSLFRGNAATVQRVEPRGGITLVAGSGRCEEDISNADGTPATGVGLCFVNGLAFDSQDRLYVSTGWNIARIDSDGTIRRIAGGARVQTAISGTLPLGDGGPAATANLNGVSSIAVDQDAIYFAQESSYDRVRRIPF
jgi:DNA-binding beta-propeller fold protein YncE